MSEVEKHDIPGRCPYCGCPDDYCDDGGNCGADDETPPTCPECGSEWEYPMAKCQVCLYRMGEEQSRHSPITKEDLNRTIDKQTLLHAKRRGARQAIWLYSHDLSNEIIHEDFDEWTEMSASEIRERVEEIKEDNKIEIDVGDADGNRQIR